MTSRLPAHPVRRVVRRLLLCAVAGMTVTGFAFPALAPRLVDGLYTREQAERGRAQYDANCADCHGTKLEGGTSTPLAGAEFIASWGKPALTLDDFYYIVRKTMPKDAAGTLSREAYTDIVAFILQQNGFPDGEKELTPDPAVMKLVRFGAPVPRADTVISFTRR